MSLSEIERFVADSAAPAAARFAPTRSRRVEPRACLVARKPAAFLAEGEAQ